MDDFEERQQRRKDFQADLEGRMREGLGGYDALSCALPRLRLEGDGRVAATARAVNALAEDFMDANPGAPVLKDAAAVERLTEAYLKAEIELRSVESTEMNLPFLSQTQAGPVHLQRTLRLRDLAALAAREPRPIAHPPAPEPTAKPKKKGWFW